MPAFLTIFKQKSEKLTNFIYSCNFLSLRLLHNCHTLSKIYSKSPTRELFGFIVVTLQPTLPLFTHTPKIGICP